MILIHELKIGLISITKRIKEKQNQKITGQSFLG